jgi:hypothetical protein
MPTVAISVDCEAANVGKCYTRELIRVAEEFTVPLTWLIFVSEKDPLSNLDLYYNEYFHRIPSWHEVGLLCCFENSQGYISDQRLRGDVIRIGKDALKSRHVKPTSFRAQRFDLLPSDLPSLEECGFLVDGSSVPGAQDKHGVARPEAPRQPYHPGYQDLNKAGDAKILSVPLCSYAGLSGYLDHGWDKARPIVESCCSDNDLIHLALTDSVDNAETLRKTLQIAKDKGARFVTLTQVATLY